MRHPLHTLRYAGPVAVLVFAAACGSTVQGAAQGAVGDPGGGLIAPGGSVPSTSLPGGTGTGAGPGGGDLTPGGGSTGATGTTTGGGASGTTTGGTGPVSLPGKATGPVKIGILLTKVGQADALGVSLGNTYSERQFDDAIIEALNKQGGLHGHRIIPVYADTDTASTSWESDYSAACSRFTEDNHVNAVLGSSFAYFASFESCLAKAGIPHLSNTTNVADNKELGQFPLLRSLIVPTIDKRSLAKLQGAMNTGFLTPANKLGVITDSCPGTQRAWNEVVKPFLAQHRITVAGTADEGCADGYNGSFSAAGAAVSNAILTFRSRGVDRVTFITVSETGTMLAMSSGASSQKYYPGWILSSLVGTSILQGQAPADEMKNARVYGWLPSQDVSPSLYGPPNAAQRRCYSYLKAGGIKPVSPADYSYAQSICEAMFAYEAALAASGGTITGSAVIQGLDHLGTRLQSVFDLDGAALFSPARRNDVPRLYREAVWRDDCSCFAYHGPTYPMP
jgi:ABC-type branched-subunit amino acid transport system substrate-binding protein